MLTSLRLWAVFRKNVSPVCPRGITTVSGRKVGKETTNVSVLVRGSVNLPSESV